MFGWLLSNPFEGISPSRVAVCVDVATVLKGREVHLTKVANYIILMKVLQQKSTIRSLQFVSSRSRNFIEILPSYPSLLSLTPASNFSRVKIFRAREYLESFASKVQSYQECSVGISLLPPTASHHVYSPQLSGSKPHRSKFQYSCITSAARPRGLNIGNRNLSNTNVRVYCSRPPRDFSTMPLKANDSNWQVSKSPTHVHCQPASEKPKRLSTVERRR